MVYFLLAVVLSVVLHLSTMAIALHLFGVRLKRISFGLGPAILKVGIVTVSPLLIGGSVTMLDSREAPVSESELAHAFNHQPVWVQVFVPLSGVFALGVLGFGLIGSAMLPALLSGFHQFINVFSPGATQIQLRNAHLFCETHNFSTVLGFTATKMAAGNLLPLPPFNGGQALVNLAKMGKPKVAWESRLFQWTILPSLWLGALWLLLIPVYIFRLMGSS